MPTNVSNHISPFNVADADVRVTLIHGNQRQNGDRPLYVLSEMDVYSPDLTYLAIAELGGFGHPKVCLEVLYQARFTTKPLHEQDGGEFYEEEENAHGLTFLVPDVNAYVDKEILPDIEAFLGRVVEGF